MKVPPMFVRIGKHFNILTSFFVREVTGNFQGIVISKRFENFGQRILCRLMLINGCLSLFGKLAGSGG